MIARDPAPKAPPQHVSGIVLAGGRSTRFGGDKLSAAVQGRTLIDYSIAVMAGVCAEVIVVIGPADAPPRLQSVAVPVHIARDATIDGGPVGGLIAGLERAGHPVVIVAGGDMPAMVGTVLELLARRVEEGAAAAALMDGAAIRPLPCAVRRTIALASVRQLSPGSRLRDVLARLDAQPVSETDWRALDPDARTLMDVDTRDDLDGLPADLA